NWSNNVYNLVTKRARAEAESHVEWIDGNIGCLAQGSRVTTPAGTKPIELVSPGDSVLAFDETAGELCFRTVTAKRFSGYQPVREVRVGERALRVTDNHPFYSYRYNPEGAEKSGQKSGQYEPAYVRADELTHAIVPVTSIGYGHPHKLERSEKTTTFADSSGYAGGPRSAGQRAPRLAQIEETTGDLMWLFGLFVGEGSVEREPVQRGGHGWARVTFSTPRDDRARPRLLEVMRHLLPGVTHEELRDGMSVRWSSVELADLFELNGFATGAAIRTRVPGWVLDLPEDQRLAFVAGCLDSVGCASEGLRGFSLESVDRSLLQDVAQILTSLGIPCRSHTEKGTEGPVGIIGGEFRRTAGHRLELRADVRLASMVSEPLRAAAARQSGLSTERSSGIGRSAIAISRSAETRPVQVNATAVVAPTWDIEVEGTGNFVSEGFIVHNSRLTMKYPSVYLVGPKASGEVLSVAYAGPGQHQDAGAKMIHAAPETTSTIVSKSISKDGGVTTYRGLVHVDPEAKGAKSFVRCDALLLDDDSVSETKPYMEVGEQDAQIGHEATVSKVGDDQLFYLMSRGLTESQAMGMIVNGFIEPITRTLPMEYAVEWSRLIELQMEGSVG
ncbi:MAG TPA: SufD family Fe-S cluster assembly protein, partial [Acidimicrobiales bacterium]|nr:SufD family Fe-S cluster assembly protein [Acidimicrobiales bacterium]